MAKDPKRPPKSPYSKYIAGECSHPIDVNECPPPPPPPPNHPPLPPLPTPPPTTHPPNPPAAYTCYHLPYHRYLCGYGSCSWNCIKLWKNGVALVLHRLTCSDLSRLPALWVPDSPWSPKWVLEAFMWMPTITCAAKPYQCHYVNCPVFRKGKFQPSSSRP